MNRCRNDECGRKLRDDWVCCPECGSEIWKPTTLDLLAERVESNADRAMKKSQEKSNRWWVAALDALCDPKALRERAATIEKEPQI